MIYSIPTLTPPQRFHMTPTKDVLHILWVSPKHPKHRQIAAKSPSGLAWASHVVETTDSDHGVTMGGILHSHPHTTTEGPSEGTLHILLGFLNHPKTPPKHPHTFQEPYLGLTCGGTTGVTMGDTPYPPPKRVVVDEILDLI